MTTQADAPNTAAEHWQARADELAAWATRRAVLRTDRYGGYGEDAQTGKTFTVTRPAKGPKPGVLSVDLLTQHFRGKDLFNRYTRDVIVGVHALRPEDSHGLFLCLDIDAHDGTEFDPEANERYAKHLYDKLTALGFRVLLLTSNGRGGFHIWVFFNALVPAAVIRAFGLWLVRDHADHGVAAEVEIYPKQDFIKPGEYGNWIRLPGKHHTRDHWAAAWGGEEWLDACGTVALILTLDGDDPRLIPLEALEGDDGGAEPARPTGKPGGVDRPGDDFCRRGTWAETGLFDEGGAAWDRQKDTDVGTVTRPGKEDGTSGTVGLVKSRNNGWPLFRCFSSNWPQFTIRSYNRFAVFAMLKHGGDFKAAAKDLAAKGYGRQGPKPTMGDLGGKAGGGEGGDGSGGDGSGPPKKEPPPEPEDLGAGEKFDDPHRLARLFLKSHTLPGGEHTLVRFRAEYLWWEDGGYRLWPDEEILAAVSRRARAAFEADYPVRVGQWEAAGKKGDPPTLFKLTSALRGNVVANLAGVVTVTDTGREPPFWLARPTGAPDADRIIAAPNGLFRIDDLAAGLGPFAQPTPHLFTRTPVPFPVETNAPPPALWLSCLKQWFNGDAGSIAALQEWFGYLLMSDTQMHQILLLIGPPRSGKGTILKVAGELVGVWAACAMRLDELGETFALENLVGKSLCTIGDARMGRKTDRAAIVERLLSISGGDPQTINRKNKSRITAYLSVRFMIASNEVMQLPDASGALGSRFHILHTPNSFLGKEDRTLFDRLKGEMPRILRWAATGRVRLLERVSRGLGFTPNNLADRHSRTFADLSSPMRKFVRQCCALAVGFQTVKDDLYAAWKKWCDREGIDPLTKPVFGKNFLAAFPAIGESHPRRGGRQIWVYAGIGVRDEEDWEDKDECDSTGDEGRNGGDNSPPSGGTDTPPDTGTGSRTDGRTRPVFDDDDPEKRHNNSNGSTDQKPEKHPRYGQQYGQGTGSVQADQFPQPETDSIHNQNGTGCTGNSQVHEEEEEEEEDIYIPPIYAVPTQSAPVPPDPPPPDELTFENDDRGGSL